MIQFFRTLKLQLQLPVVRVPQLPHCLSFHRTDSQGAKIGQRSPKISGQRRKTASQTSSASTGRPKPGMLHHKNHHLLHRHCKFRRTTKTSIHLQLFLRLDLTTSLAWMTTTHQPLLLALQDSNSQHLRVQNMELESY